MQRHQLKDDEVMEPVPWGIGSGCWEVSSLCLTQTRRCGKTHWHFLVKEF